jgi:glycerol-3-phosphate acyltransferase PlsY
MGEEMQKQIDEMNQSLKDSESAYGDNQRNVGNYSDALGQVPGVVGQATNSIKGMSASLKALLANPVVLVIAGIVAILSTLYKAFTRSEEGQNKMAKATAIVSSLFTALMDVLEVVANVLVDAFSKPQESIKKFAKLIKENIVNRFEGLIELIPALGRSISALFSGDFEKAGTIAANAMGKLTLGVDNVVQKTKDAIKSTEEFSKKLADNAKKAGIIADKEAELVKLRREQRKIQLQYQLDAEKLRQIRDDEAKSMEERYKANERLGKLLAEQSSKELSIANKELSLVKMKIDLEGKTTELLDKRAEAELQIIDIQERIAGQQSEQLVNINSLNREVVAKTEEKNKALIALNNTLQDIILDNEDKTNENQLAIIEQKYDALFRLNENNTDALIELEKQKNADAAATSLEIASNAISTLAQLKDMETEQNIARINRERDAQIAAIQGSTLSEEQKALKIAEINKKAEAKAEAERKKNAESQKRFALVQIALDTAKGIAAAVAAGAGLVFPANLPAIAAGIAAVLSGIVSATAAVNAAKFALGGEIPMDGGFITGNSHSQGGVKFSAGGRLMEAEGGEIIVNKGIQKRPDFVRAISQMNYMTGGKKFETGGIVAPVFSAAGASLAASEQSVGSGFTFEIPPIQVLNNVVDTTSQQSSIIQIQNQTSIGG